MMTDEPVSEGNAVVWSATWVPAASPFDDFGQAGYAAAWVDVGDASRHQVLVDGPQPGAGTTGAVRRRTMTSGAHDVDVLVFVADGEAGSA